MGWRLVQGALIGVQGGSKRFIQRSVEVKIKIRGIYKVPGKSLEMVDQKRKLLE